MIRLYLNLMAEYSCLVDVQFLGNLRNKLASLDLEFVALAAAGKEAESLRNLILEIPLWCKPIAPISIRGDSAATLVKAYIQMYNGKSRH
ncbi:hypothetical protein Tco_0923992 [Tanacetum coccineum]|uniref:Uncharacterized protein n=1 Tax=Tanacetum coccineum TaxID=301880 RepID=A0ABQ5D4T6_9ASTR